MEIVNAEIVPFDDLELPPTLYKYRNWHGEYDRRMISHREVFYAYPVSFEDKYDCRNPVRWDLLTHEEILNKYFQDSLKDNFNYSLQEHMEFAIDWANNSAIKDPEFINKKQAEIFKKFNQCAGVLCLTAYPAEEKMWEKYAVNHTGFCVGFDPKVMLRDLGSGGCEVFYEDELPIIHPINHTLRQRSILQIFYKLKEWEFEKEYRSYRFKTPVLSAEDRKVLVPANAFKEIILGANMPEESETELLSSIPKELEHVQIKKASFEDGKMAIKSYIATE